MRGARSNEFKSGGIQLPAHRLPDDKIDRLMDRYSPLHGDSAQRLFALLQAEKQRRREMRALTMEQLEEKIECLPPLSQRLLELARHGQQTAGWQRNSEADHENYNLRFWTQSGTLGFVDLNTFDELVAWLAEHTDCRLDRVTLNGKAIPFEKRVKLA